MAATLSLEATPPLWVPVQFLVTAPLFGLLFALTLGWFGPETLLSPWMPGLLGATHLLVLGYLAMAMFGALQQLLPVLVGAPAPRSRAASLIILTLLAAGTFALSSGLAWTQPLPMRIGSAALALAILLFASDALRSLLRSGVRDMTALAVTLAIAALGLTALLGLWLAVGHMDLGQPLARRFTDLHLAWGLIGWVALLVAAVAVHVVPMFQITPPYPRAFVLGFAPVVFLLLTAYTVQRLSAGSAAPALPERLLEAGLALALALFAVLTLWIQGRRRRRQRDVMVDSWRLGMAALLAATALWGLEQAFPGHIPQPGLGIALGWLFIAGFAVSVINGMLYKIVPFLIWLHLNRAQARTGVRGIRIPTLNDAVPARRMRAQLLLHAAAVVVGLAAVWLPLAFYPALAAFAAASALLFANLVHALRRYHRALHAIERTAAPAPGG